MIRDKPSYLSFIRSRNRKISTECNTILSLQQRYPGKYKQSGKRRRKCGCDLPVYGFWRDNDPGR